MLIHQQLNIGRLMKNSRIKMDVQSVTKDAKLIYSLLIGKLSKSILPCSKYLHFLDLSWSSFDFAKLILWLFLASSKVFFQSILNFYQMLITYSKDLWLRSRRSLFRWSCGKLIFNWSSSTDHLFKKYSRLK